METFILDGDWGGDEMQLAAVLLSQPQQANILGVTSVFGNASLEHCTRNARDILHFLKASSIPVYAGAANPSGTQPSEGDGAHGDNGLGGVSLPASPAPHTSLSACDFILQTLRAQPAHSVTITASGPLTNIAQALAKDPDTMRRVKRIIVMGGCMNDIPAHDMPLRRGNITPHAEFNFYVAPHDAHTVMQSGLPITLIPMDCSQQLAFTDENRQQLTRSLMRDPHKKAVVMAMTSCADTLDQSKFGSNQFMHDVHCALFALYPNLYTTSLMGVGVLHDGDQKGRSEACKVGPAIEVAHKLKDPKTAFDIVRKSLETCLFPARDRVRA